jgi:hypothetical protein
MDANAATHVRAGSPAQDRRSSGWHRRQDRTLARRADAPVSLVRCRRGRYPPRGRRISRVCRTPGPRVGGSRRSNVGSLRTNTQGPTVPGVFIWLAPVSSWAFDSERFIRNYNREGRSGCCLCCDPTAGGIRNRHLMVSALPVRPRRQPATHRVWWCSEATASRISSATTVSEQTRLSPVRRPPARSGDCSMGMPVTTSMTCMPELLESKNKIRTCAVGSAQAATLQPEFPRGLMWTTRGPA